jgi:hypothetical protein
MVLGAISPLLFNALTPYLEEGEDHVFIYGIKSEIVTEFLAWVYKGEHQSAPSLIVAFRRQNEIISL